MSFSYDDRPILKSIYLDIKKGEKIAIVGKNGAGKSTLAKAISSFIQTEGRYLWVGQDIKGDSVAERAERVGYVLQNPNEMISTNMIFDEVALGLRLRGVDEQEIETRVYETLKSVVFMNSVIGLFLPFRLDRKNVSLLPRFWF